jgi:hypothetical protein
MFIDEKSTSHLSIKSQVEIDEEQEQKIITNTIIKQVCSFKTFHGLELPTRYDAKHCKFISIANGLKTSKEKLAIDGKQKKLSKPSREKKEE